MAHQIQLFPKSFSPSEKNERKTVNGRRRSLVFVLVFGQTKRIAARRTPNKQKDFIIYLQMNNDEMSR